MGTKKSQSPLPPNAPGLPNPPPVADTQLDLFKLEYTQAAERYENIYKATWQSFYYLAVLSAAILTFGSQQLALWLAMLFAGLPMLFWYYVQFLPLDRYAKGVVKRLATIEEIFNAKHFHPVVSVVHLPAPQPQPGASEYRMNHYIKAAAPVNTDILWCRYPIRKALFWSAVFLIPLWVGCIILAFAKQPPNSDWFLAAKASTPIPIKIESDSGTILIHSATPTSSPPLPGIQQPSGTPPPNPSPQPAATPSSATPPTNSAPATPPSQR